MKYQARGPIYVAARDANGKPGAFIQICTDTMNVALTTESFEHINKCGPVDVPDYRGIKSVSGELTISFSDLEDAKFAFATIGTETAAEVAPVAVTGEALPSGLVAGDVVFLGGAEMNRNITSLVVQDSDSTPATATLTTNYTLDATTGKVTIVDPSTFTQPFIVAYSHQNPASVSMLSSAQKEYFVRQENINKANSNDPGSVELYKVRFDPPSNLDFQSEELQIAELKGTVLADDTKAVTDTEFGQFGRRIL